MLNPDVPVIVSAGFNLGRLVPKLTSLRHLTSAEDFEAMKGEGVRARVEGKTVSVVSRQYLEKQGKEVPR